MADMNHKLHITYGDFILGVSGEGVRYLFSYQGGLVSLCADGREWLYRAPRPTFWRAVTDNDRGNGFPLKSGMWMSADVFMGSKSVYVKADGKEIPFPAAPENNRYTEKEYAQEIEIAFEYETITAPQTTVDVIYHVAADGTLRVTVTYHGKKGLPELPVFGMRFIMPTAAEGYTYQGLSGETYPDRMAGGIPGVYEVDGLPVTPYLVPQDCGVHMETEWLEIRRGSDLDNRSKDYRQTVLRFEQTDSPFAFSCLPYTAQELENATHQEELPPERRTVLCIYGAVRGVGGIDSWGADVEEPFHISGEEDISFSFDIEYCCKEADYN